MTINEYQALAMRTASGMNYEHHGMLMNGALGLCGESGEVADIVKKATFQGHELDINHVAKELGDVAWYLAVSATAIGVDLETILKMNIDKLRKRYPDGFSSERSQHREAGDV
jgi:NTP pyrophosphatase (non-canonical NTP hydrolase)